MRLFLVLSFFVATVSAWAQPSAEELQGYFDQALQAYKSGDYPRSIALYETILREGQSSSALHNNLGLAYYKAGKAGKAIVHFERALRQNSGNNEAANNLQVAQQTIKEPILPAEEMFIVRAWRGVRGLLGSGGWGIVFLAIWAAALGVWAWNWKADKDAVSVQRKSIPFALLGLGFFALVFGFQQLSSETDENVAVVTRPKTGLRPEPDLGSPEVLVLYEGTQMQVIERSEGWWQVELSNGSIGWVLANMVETI